MPASPADGAIVDKVNYLTDIGRMGESAVAAVRRFNRFYTQKIGVLHEGFLRTPFSLTEGRVLYELAQRENTTASAIAADLGLDAGYLSRILSAFQRQRLVGRSASESDGRKSLLRLTGKGKKAFAQLNSESRHEIAAMLSSVDAAGRAKLVGAMQTIERLLGAAPEHKSAFILRAPEPGDMGWVVQRHGVLYAQEYGWDERFEALVAGIIAGFVEHFDPKGERCWIAERGNENVGSIFLVKKSQTIAKLRLLLVEPTARGLGIGNRLVEECIGFARSAGYKKVVLWTNDILHSARRIYIAHGFRLVKEERHESFGHDLVGQFWELKFK